MDEPSDGSIDDWLNPFGEDWLERKEGRRRDLEMAAFGDRESLTRLRRGVRVIENVMNLMRRRIGEKGDEQRRGGQMAEAVRPEICLRPLHRFQVERVRAHPKVVKFGQNLSAVDHVTPHVT